MSVYFIANLQIHDEEGYQKYCELMNEDMVSFNGKYLAVETKAEVLEGEWNYDRLVLLEFSDQDALYAWYNSLEYQEIIKLRTNSTKSDVIVVKGL